MYPRNKCSWNKGALKTLAGGGSSSRGALGCSPHLSMVPAFAHTGEDGLKGLAEGMSSGGEGWQKMV